MGQTRLKDPVEPVSAVSKTANYRGLHRPEPHAINPALAKLQAPDEFGDEFKDDLRALKRGAGWSAIAAGAFLAVAGATGHLVTGLLVLGGLTAGVALLVAWGNWLLDNTATW